MATTPGTRRPEHGSVSKPKPDPGLRLARNLVALAFLIIVLGIGFIELRTYLTFRGVVESLDRHVSGSLSRADAERIIGAAPGASGVDEGLLHKITYRWRGLFRTHTLDVYYTTDKEPVLSHLDVR
jgi:hypothetical protein